MIDTPPSDDALCDSALKDRFGRHINYLRLSVTDRCDFRCTYCMAEDIQFLPRSEVLSLEELVRVGKIFSELGVRKIRVTGGEPLVRKNLVEALEALASLPQMQELCLTTNGSQLSNYAQKLFQSGVDRINISVDSLDEQRFQAITRNGNLPRVLQGIKKAQSAGFKRIKINSVILRHRNFDEVHRLANFALKNNFDISFIEEMPLGEISSHNRQHEFVSSAEIRNELSKHFVLHPSLENSGGPSRYWQVAGYTSRIGFISPHSENFCQSCNRVRVTASGRLVLCLGNEHDLNLRDLLREYPNDDETVKKAIVASMSNKPEKHNFDLGDSPQILRFMSATGG